MSAVILGGSGFLGTQILKKYKDIISVGRTQPFEARYHINCASIEQLPEVLEKLYFDRVIMLIGNSDFNSLNNTETFNVDEFEKNVLPIKKLFSYFRNNKKIEKLISIGTVSIYDKNNTLSKVDETQKINPYKNNYIFSKYLAEEVSKLYSDVPSITARASTIYGEYDRYKNPLSVNRMIKELVLDGTTKVKALDAVRDFIHVEDVADAIMSLTYSNLTGPVNVCSSILTPTSELVQLLESASRLKIDTSDITDSDIMNVVLDNSLLKSTGWEQKIDIETGIRETYAKMYELLKNR